MQQSSKLSLRAGGKCWRRSALPPTEDNDTTVTEPDRLGSDIPVRLIQWGGTLPSRRRFVQGLSFATFVALGGNFAGVSSFLLGLDGGGVAGKTKLDVLVPVRGFKRCWNPDLGFEFQYPAAWLGDQRLARRAAERIERENPLDLPPIKSRSSSSFTSDPVAAFGPAGSRGEENMSVIVTEAAQGFELSDLGSVQQAAEKLLRERIAPDDSDKTAKLIDASQRRDAAGILYYEMEYAVQTPRWQRHNIAVFSVQSQRLYTFNAQCSEDRWVENREQFKTAALSFRVFDRQALF